MSKLIGGAACAVAFFYLTGVAAAVEQPHMDAALAALEQAKHEIELADAARDHGGHAEKATKAIDRAIHQVRDGIRYRNKH
jgi:hypothetical protein